jgi:hypothetical protein
MMTGAEFKWLRNAKRRKRRVNTCRELREKPTFEQQRYSSAAPACISSAFSSLLAEALREGWRLNVGGTTLKTMQSLGWKELIWLS